MFSNMEPEDISPVQKFLLIYTLFAYFLSLGVIFVTLTSDVYQMYNVIADYENTYADWRFIYGMHLLTFISSYFIQEAEKLVDDL